MSEKKDFSQLIKTAKIPILILDQKWHQLFLVNGKTEEIAEKEKELNELLQKEARLKQDIKDYKKVKQNLMNGIVAGMDDNSEARTIDVEEKKRLIDDANAKIEQLEDELLEIPRTIRETNEVLMVLTADYCYDNFRKNTEKINEIAAWIKQVRHDLKVNVVKKQNREINTRQMYAYMHDVFGPQATNLFDLQNMDVNLSFHDDKKEAKKDEKPVAKSEPKPELKADVKPDIQPEVKQDIKVDFQEGTKEDTT